MNALNKLYLTKLEEGLVAFGFNALDSVIKKYGIGVVDKIIVYSADSTRIKDIDYKLVPLVEENPNFLKNISKYNPQVITLLTGEIKQARFRTIDFFYKKNPSPKTVVAVRDLEYEDNIGNIIRTAYGMGVDLIFISNTFKNIFSPVVAKISGGTNFCIDIVQSNFYAGLKLLRQKDFQIIGLDMNGENIMDMEYNDKVCFALGRESEGVSETLMSYCDNIVSIPMRNKLDSLNVSNAFAMSIYDRNLKKYVNT